MPSASGANAELSYVREVSHGVTPITPAMKTLRTIGKNINRTRGVLRSAQQTSRRMRRDARLGFRQAAGSLPFELSMLDFDDIIEGALSGTWDQTTTGSTSLAMSASGPTRPAGSFIVDGFVVGQEVDLIGFTGDNNVMNARIMALTATTMSLDVTGLTPEAEAPARTVEIAGRALKVGSDLRTHTIERRLTDVGQYQVFTGCAVNGLSLNFSPEAILGGTIDIIGMDGTGWTDTSLGDPAGFSESSPFDSFTGALFVDGVELGTVTGFTLNITNNRALSAVLMRQTSPDVFEGQNETTGQMTVHFNPDLADRFDQEAESYVEIRMDDLNGVDFHKLIVPRVKWLGDAIDPPQNGPIIMTMPYEALEDTAYASNLVWQISNTATP